MSSSDDYYRSTSRDTVRLAALAAMRTAVRTAREKATAAPRRHDTTAHPEPVTDRSTNTPEEQAVPTTARAECQTCGGTGGHPAPTTDDPDRWDTCPYCSTGETE